MTRKLKKGLGHIFFISLILIIVIVGVVIFYFMIKNESSKEIGSETLSEKSKALAENLELDIRFSKSNYEKGESVEDAEYYLKYDGEPFQAIVLYHIIRDGEENPYYSMTIGLMDNVDYDIDSKGFNVALESDRAGQYIFYKEGNYIYEISVYSCEDIKNILGKSCDNLKVSDMGKIVEDSKVSPLKKVIKTIIVQGGVDPSECKESSDCTESCVGCKDGIKICEQVSEKCVECFIDNQCKSGYECRNNSCVLKIIEETETEQNETPIDTGNEFISCNKDLGCFKDLSTGCNLGNLSHETTLNWSWIQTTGYLYEIKGKIGIECKLFLKIISVSGKYSAEQRQIFMNEEGMTSQEIDELEQQTNDALQDAAIGGYGNCYFEEGELTHYLNSMVIGQTSPDLAGLPNPADYGYCEGEIFGE